ncbi:MAG: PAS domain S-box protein [Thermoplasmata archaeon]
MSGTSGKKQREESSTDSDGLFKAILEAIPNPVVLFDSDGVIRHVNDAMAKASGWTVSELLGKNISDMLTPSKPDGPDVKRLMEAMRTEAEPPRRRIKLRMRCKDSRPLDLSWRFAPLDARGQPVSFVGIGSDVPDVIRGDDAAGKREDFFRLLAENSRDLVFRYRFKPNPGFEYVSPSATEITGYTPEEHYADPQLGLKIVHPDDRALLEAMLRPPFDTSKPIAIRWIRKDGKVIWTEMQLTPDLDPSGEVVALNGVSRDVTERRLVSEALQKNLRSVVALLDSLPGYAFFKDAQGVYVMANQPFSEAVGCPKEQVPGKTDFDLFPRDLARKYRSDDEKVLSTGKELYVGEEQMVRGGEKVTVATRKVPVRDADGKVVGIIGLAFDISERKQYEEKMKLRLRYESLLNEISSMGMRLDSVDEILGLSTGIVGGGFDASRAYVFSYDSATGTWSNTHEWVATGVRANKDNLQRLPESQFPYWMERLSKGEAISFERVEDIPSDLERERLLAQGAKSTVAVPLRSADGTLFGFLGLDQCDTNRRWSGEDIDLLLSISRMLMALVSQKRAEAQLQESEQRYRSFFENTGSATAIIEDDMTISLVNSEFERISGYKKEEIIGHRWPEFVHAEDVQRMAGYHVLRRSDPGKAPSSYEFRFIAKDGRILDVRANMSMVPGTKKSIGVFHDVTAAKKAEMAVAESERFLSSVFSSIQDGISVLDTDMRIVRVNRAMEQWYSHAMPLVGKRCYEAYHGRNEPCDTCPTSATIKTGAVARSVVPKVGPNRDVVGWLELYTFPQRDPASGQVMGVIEYVRDVSESRLYEDALRKANEKLQLMGSITRHDALNQLSVLYGWLDIASQGANSEPLKGYLKRMRDAADTIRSQLEFTADYQEMGVRGASWIDVEGSLNRGMTGLGMAGITFEQDVAGLELYCDPLLDKVFHNLIDNSLRHGGKVSSIRVSYNETPEGLTLVYEDDGVGVANEHKELIFEAGRGRHKGYGLFLARAILGITGITIQEKGIPGKGARFEIRAPKDKYRMNRDRKTRSQRIGL